MKLPSPTHSNYSNLLTDIERGQVKIPQFQREFVWTLQKSAALLDSVVKGYPLGTFIFWATRDRLRCIRNLGNAVLPEAKEGEKVSYILDGQQRLTSLYASLRGVKVARESGDIDDFSQMYLNLHAKEDEQIVVTDTEGLKDKTWIQLHDLIEGNFALLGSFPEEFHKKIQEYQTRIKSYEFSIIEVQDVPIEVATEIFTRINVGGKALSVFEIMVAKTYDDKRDFDLSVKFKELVTGLEPVDYETVSEATVLQLVSLILAKDCKRQTILKLGRNEFIDTWKGAIEGFEQAVEYFRNTYRIPVSSLLPYNTLLVPFAYFFYYHKDKPNADQRLLLQDFFWRCSLVGRYSSAVESKLAQDLRRIDKILSNESPDYDWGVDISPEFLIQNGWFNAGRSFVKAILCIYAYHLPQSFNDNSIVNISNNWLKQANSKNYHHFFPRSYLLKKGVEEQRVNNVINITIVDDYLNKREIRARAPSEYMKRFSESNSKISDAMETHLIGEFDTYGISNNDYDTFLNVRAARISDELKLRIIPRPIDSVGQLVKTDDVDGEPVASA